jgi:hypothetical protein
MGKVIFEFDSVEEQDDIRMVLDGHKWRLILWDLDQMLRSTERHGTSLLKLNEEATDIEMNVAEKLREAIRESMNDNGVNFD